MGLLGGGFSGGIGLFGFPLQGGGRGKGAGCGSSRRGRAAGWEGREPGCEAGPGWPGDLAAVGGAPRGRGRAAGRLRPAPGRGAPRAPRPLRTLPAGRPAAGRLLPPPILSDAAGAGDALARGGGAAERRRGGGDGGASPSSLAGRRSAPGAGTIRRPRPRPARAARPRGGRSAGEPRPPGAAIETPATDEHRTGPKPIASCRPRPEGLHAAAGESFRPPGGGLDKAPFEETRAPLARAAGAGRLLLPPLDGAGRHTAPGPLGPEGIRPVPLPPPRPEPQPAETLRSPADEPLLGKPPDTLAALAPSLAARCLAPNAGPERLKDQPGFHREPTRMAPKRSATDRIIRGVGIGSAAT